MAVDLVTAIVFALAAAVLGGPEALRLLLNLAGQSSPIADVAIIVGVICAVTSAVLGAMLLVRFIHVAGNAPDRATERFARVTLTVAVAAISLVAVCLLAAPSPPSPPPTSSPALPDAGACARSPGGFGRGCHYEVARSADLWCAVRREPRC